VILLSLVDVDVVGRPGGPTRSWPRSASPNATSETRREQLKVNRSISRCT